MLLQEPVAIEGSVGAGQQPNDEPPKPQRVGTGAGTVRSPVRTPRPRDVSCRHAFRLSRGLSQASTKFQNVVGLRPWKDEYHCVQIVEKTAGGQTVVSSRYG